MNRKSPFDALQKQYWDHDYLKEGDVPDGFTKLQTNFKSWCDDPLATIPDDFSDKKLWEVHDRRKWEAQAFAYFFARDLEGLGDCIFDPGYTFPTAVSEIRKFFALSTWAWWHSLPAPLGDEHAKFSSYFLVNHEYRVMARSGLITCSGLPSPFYFEVEPGEFNIQAVIRQRVEVPEMFIPGTVIPQVIVTSVLIANYDVMAKPRSEPSVATIFRRQRKSVYLTRRAKHSARKFRVRKSVLVQVLRKRQYVFPDPPESRVLFDTTMDLPENVPLVLVKEVHGEAFKTMQAHTKWFKDAFKLIFLENKRGAKPKLDKEYQKLIDDVIAGRIDLSSATKIHTASKNGKKTDYEYEREKLRANVNYQRNRKPADTRRLFQPYILRKRRVYRRKKV